MKQPSATSDVVTDGIRIRAAAEYRTEESDPDRPSYVFGYRIEMSNEGTSAATLEHRHWIIVDGEGRPSEVRGGGVVGEFPRLAPGGRYEYSSRCPLPTPWGSMEGSYRFRRDDGRTFEVKVGRFFLATNLPTIAAQTSDPERAARAE
ncbi:MAG: Co2+/Mg2+ efflux protein ApaG [Planctomycetota bacterium]